MSKPSSDFDQVMAEIDQNDGYTFDQCVDFLRRALGYSREEAELVVIEGIVSGNLPTVTIQ